MESNETLDAGLIQQELRVSEQHIASGGKRFANYLIDWIVLYLLKIVLLFGYMRSVDTDMSGYFTSILISILLLIVYYTVMESILGKTVGKFITGTRVVYEDFSKPSAGKIFVRSLCRIIPFEPFSCLGSKPTGWHDTIPELWVIDEKAMRQ